jgi:hypothetical protein
MAQQPADLARANVRIVSPIDENQLVTLKGNVHPAAIAKNDRGPVSASLPMQGLVLVLSRSAEQQAAFDAYVESEYDSGSPNFHQWLSADQIGERFGPSETDIATITGWLTSQGFAVSHTAKDRMTITFGGTAGQVQSAFHTSIHNLSVNGVAHIANMTNPSIPAALAPVVMGVKQLHDFHPHPLHKVGGVVQFNQELGKWQRAAGASANAATPRPLFTIPAADSQSGLVEEDVSPYDFATIYNVKPLWTASTPITGTGQTIAIVGTTDICLGQSGSPCNSVNDVSSYKSSFGLPAGLTPVQVNGNSYPPGVCTSSTNACGIGDLEENTLDVEVSGAVAPGAQIVLVASGYNNQTNPTNDPIFDSAQYIEENSTVSGNAVYGAHVMNVSYGECELFQGTTGNVNYYNLWQSAAAEGIAVFVASGDSGSPACDQGYDGNGNPYSAQFGLAVSGVASTPYNTAVGGTDFSWCQPTLNSSGDVAGCPTTGTSYWSATNNSSNNSSASGYVPETPWNDTCENPIMAKYLESFASFEGVSGVSTQEEACNFVENYWYPYYESVLEQYDQVDVIAGFVDTAGGGGGASSCVVNDADTTPSSDLPACTAASSVSTGSGTVTLSNDGWPVPSWQTGVTGTSGLTARSIPDVSFFAGDGSLDSATLVCLEIVAGASCSQSNVLNSALEIGGTSVASPEMAGVMALINQKAGGPQGSPNKQLYELAGKQTYSSCSAESVTNSSSCYFQSIDEGTTAMPCSLGVEGAEGGAVLEDGQWLVSPEYAYTGLASPNCTTINSVDAGGIGTLVSSGTTAAYNATAGYNLATGLGSLNVANVVNGWTSDSGTKTPTMNVTLSPTGTITSTTALTVTVAVTGTSGTPTGTVAVSGGGFAGNGTLNGSGDTTVTIPAGTLAPGSDTLTVTYSGDGTYTPLTQTETVTVSAAVPTVTVTPQVNPSNINNALVVAITVSGPAGSTSPTGTVTLAQTGGTYSSPAATLSSGTASITIPAASLTAGTDTLKATYSGDTNYTTATGTATETIVGTALLTPTVTVTPNATSIDTSQGLNLAVKVTGTGATPGGTITLTSPSLSPAPTVTLDASGSGPLVIPAYSLSAGSQTITVGYSGDANYKSASGSATVTVTTSTFALSATTPTAVSPGSSTTSSITGTPSSTDYTGAVTLKTCTLTSSSVTNPTSPASCTVSGTITYAAGAATGTGTATITTTSNSAMLESQPGGKGWLGAGGGAVLAFLVFLGIPARRRSWRALMGIVVLLAALGTLAACGGGSINSGGGGGSTATSAGTYTFTVTGQGSDPSSTTGTGTFTVTVN